jgi:hypothetical protein
MAVANQPNRQGIIERHSFVLRNSSSFDNNAGGSSCVFFS